jgi:hypothetical protein
MRPAVCYVCWNISTPPGKEVIQLSKSDIKVLAAVFFGFLFVIHMITIAEDVQVVIEDPNLENKPAEVAKLIFDLSRYWPK